MSLLAAASPQYRLHATAIEQRVVSVAKEVDGIELRRFLPVPERRMIGPFVMIEQIGPSALAPRSTPGSANLTAHLSIEAAVHPLAGMSAFTWLFDGEILHRNSLGIKQVVRRGDIGWLTAGHGVVVSEQPVAPSHPGAKAPASIAMLHGLRCWAALPQPDEEADASFVYVAANEVPRLLLDGVQVRVAIGEAYGRRSPIHAPSTMLVLECRMPRNSTLPLPEGVEAIAVQVVTGEICIDGRAYPSGVLAIARAGRAPRIDSASDSIVMVIGGDAIGERYLLDGFVASSSGRVERARRDWLAGRMGALSANAVRCG